jgi:hypothetical protein
MADVIPKWSAGPSYGPVLSSVDLYLLQSASGIKTLELHPILTHSLPSFHLVFNLSTGQTGGYSEADRDKDLAFTHKDEPATLPRVQELFIITRISPWVTTVRNERGVTIGDVCQSMWQQYSESQITEAEFGALPPRWQEQVKRAAANTQSHWGLYYNSPSQTPKFRRTDWLRDKVFFDGLELDAEYTEKRLGFKAPNVFVMDLCA